MRSAISSSLAISAIAPMRIEPDSPVRADASCGTPHSGPMRGNSRNSATITGAPSNAARAATLAAWRSGGLPTGMCASTSAVSRPHTDSSMAAAVATDCEYRKFVNTRKKPRKKTTSASRRARSSSVFSAISTTSMVTPASLPKSVRSVHSVSIAATSSTPATAQRLGSGPLLKARRTRQNSINAVRAMHHGARCAMCGAMVQAITAS
jgi:hypothetical protein